MKPILSHKITQGIVAGFILLAVYIIMYPPDIDLFRKTSEFAVHLMFALLGLSFILLIFNQTRLMFISMLACGFLAFYLKTASNSNLVLPQHNNLPKIKVAHFNLSSFDAYDPDFKDIILGTDCDIISFQEYTPDWDAYITKTLKDDFPQAHKMVRIDLFGMAIYSKKVLSDIETFFYKEIPNINFTINTGYQDVHIISSYIAPPNYKSKQLNSKNHLQELAVHIGTITKPKMALGDFNQVYWSSEITGFREKTQLNNSRRNISLTSKVPYDHIFYSDQLECIAFREIKSNAQQHLGIAGTFQAKSAITNPAILRTIETAEKK